jgi:hypothetical protein
MTAASSAASTIRVLEGRLGFKPEQQQWAVLCANLESCTSDGLGSPPRSCSHVPHCASIKRTYIFELVGRRLALERQILSAFEESSLALLLPLSPQV